MSGAETVAAQHHAEGGEMGNGRFSDPRWHAWGRSCSAAQVDERLLLVLGSGPSRPVESGTKASCISHAEVSVSCSLSTWSFLNGTCEITRLSSNSSSSRAEHFGSRVVSDE